MKRILAFFLCVVLVFSVAAITGSAADETDAARDAAVTEVQTAIANLANVTVDSRADLEKVNQQINDFYYNYGHYQAHLLGDTTDFDVAITKFNLLLDYKEGDINSDDKIDAKDALEVLKFTVGKIMFTDHQKLCADVDYNNQYGANDALMILQYSVGKRTEFPSQVVDHTPFVKTEPGLYSQKSVELFDATYQSMIERTRSDGYTQTSLTGAYEGMYFRDASIQILAHIGAEDFDQARLILNYITEYHRMNRHSYVIHIQRRNNSYFKQADTTFFFLHSWYLFATKAPKTEANVNFIASSEGKMKEFANYYLDNGYLHDKYDLLYNESFEHSRDGSYWLGYDLTTNVYASQALHEMAEYFKDSDPTNAQKWQDASTKIANGIHKNLTAELNGGTMYAELRGRSEKNIQADPNTEEQFIAGFSWVNLAPMGCDWYAADADILEHTYQMYLKYGACRYYRGKTKMNYTMMDAYTSFKLNAATPIRTGNHIIGKGLAWEILYCAKMGYTDRLTTISAFIEEFSTKFYPEVWAYSGGVNDTGNQEQACWLLYANKIAFPEINQ